MREPDILLREEDREDIQALVLYGTKSPLLRWHFFRIDDPAKARRFIDFFLRSGPLQVNTAGESHSGDRAHMVYVALTWQGLRGLGLDERTLASFPAEFRSGARQGAVNRIGDVTEAEARGWVISDEAAHLAVMLYARERQGLFDQSTVVIRTAGECGCVLLRYLDGEALPDGTHASGQHLTRPVHFGYSDGIAQPSIEGEDDPNLGGPPQVKPGTLLLGHGDPRTAATNHQPLNPPELGANGTFGAFRMFEQDCDGFEEYLDRHSTDAASRELLAARMCGRWRNGVPLAMSPDDPFVATPLAGHQLNDFDYAPTAAHPTVANDARGLRCPIGAHVRRTNPRSAETLGNLGHSIRLIRRGIPYGPPHVRHDGQERGMLGLFLCASLKHQFEFVMQHWMNDGLFARGLDPAERDPFLEFIATRGAAYLFFPSRTALRLLADGRVASIAPAPPAPTPSEPVPPVPSQPREIPSPSDPDEAHLRFAIDDIKARVGRGTSRDAHPKHHGLVKAVFTVLDHQTPALAHGLFATPGHHTAYIRFSNGSPNRLTPDGEPDLRGMAIKLFGIDGEKLGDEEWTHDFVLASDPRFFVKNLRDYSRFLTTERRLQPIEFPVLRTVFRSHHNPLTIRYFSQTPYACGPHMVKYSVAPDDPPEQPSLSLSTGEIARRGDDYLRAAMAATLAAQDVTMRFMLQLAPPEADIDDATDEWRTAFTTVAQIVIPRQEFRSRQQMTLGEQISFNPWHAIAAHRPLGTINAGRREIYEAIARLRLSNAGADPREPTGTEL